MRILVDKQEKTPFSFPDGIETRRAHLVNGDYALEGDGSFSIERKSLSDFLGTISSGWEQFEHEMYRMERFGTPIKIILVEGDFAQCLFCEDADGNVIPPPHDHPALTPEFVAKRIAELALIHRAEVLFCGDAEGGALMCEKIFEQRNIQIKGAVKFNKKLGGHK